MKFNLTKTEWFIFVVFGLSLFIIPYLFTRPWGIFPINDVGETIGGVTAPFLGFFGSILVYLALKAQVKANAQVQKQFIKQEEAEKYRNNITLANEKVNILKSEINNFFYLHRDESLKGSPLIAEYKGSQAIFILLSTNINTFYGQSKKNSFELQPKFTELYKLLIFFSDTISNIKCDQFDANDKTDKLIKENFISILCYLFEAKIKWNFKSLEVNKSKHLSHCPGDCGLNHGLPVELFDKVDEITKMLE